MGWVLRRRRTILGGVERQERQEAIVALDRGRGSIHPLWSGSIKLDTKIYKIYKK